MAKAHPPLELLLQMGKGTLDVMTSIACLTAALAVQRGDFSAPTVETAGGEPFTADERAALLAAVESAREGFLAASPEALQSAIDLYVAHLKFCGFSAEWGLTN